MEKFDKDLNKNIFDGVNEKDLESGPFGQEFAQNLNMQNYFVKKEVQIMRDHISDLEKLKTMLDSVSKQLLITNDLCRQMKKSKDSKIESAFLKEQETLLAEYKMF